MIERITPDSDFAAPTRLLNTAFATIAQQFGFTKESNPTNNAFITADELRKQLTDNREFYCYRKDDEIIGFIALEKSSTEPGTFYIEKVGVHPDYRHAGIGLKLMDFATQRICQLGGRRISIGLIDSNTILKQWYQKQGYKQFLIRSFAHLPFDVCLMEKSINP